MALAAGLYFAWNSQRILNEGWEYGAPPTRNLDQRHLLRPDHRSAAPHGRPDPDGDRPAVRLVSGVRRQDAGPDLPACRRAFADTIAYHIVSAESAFGIPMKAFGEIVVGFIVFGVALNYTGGGRFFNDVAFALVGHIRGGAAQVGIVSSALQGSISGSVISNVISSGVVTIPAMKRTGFSATYAGAVEFGRIDRRRAAPPVMGSTAFVMASFLGIPYSEIALAAAIPALALLFRAHGAGRCLCGAARPQGHAPRGAAAAPRNDARGLGLHPGLRRPHLSSCSRKIARRWRLSMRRR